MTKAGTPCGQSVPNGDRLCIWHSPARRAEAVALRTRAREVFKAKASAIAARRRMAQAEIPPDLDGTLASISVRQRWVLDRQAAGMLTDRAAQTQLTGLRDYRESLVKENLERQVKELRAKLETANRKIGRSSR